MQKMTTVTVTFASTKNPVYGVAVLGVLGNGRIYYVLGKRCVFGNIKPVLFSGKGTISGKFKTHRFAPEPFLFSGILLVNFFLKKIKENKKAHLE